MRRLTYRSEGNSRISELLKNMQHLLCVKDVEMGFKNKKFCIQVFIYQLIIKAFSDNIKQFYFQNTISLQISLGLAFATS